MKIVHIITGLDQGGAENALFRLVTNDKTNNHIVISLMGYGVYGDRLIDLGFEVHVMEMKRGVFDFRAFLILTKLLKKMNPTVVQTWMYHADLFGGMAAKFAGNKKIMWGIHNYNITSGAIGKSTKLVVKICALLSHFIPQKIISCSEKSILVHKSIGYSNKKIVYIPLGYDLKEFMPNSELRTSFRTQYGINPDTIILGCVARWDPQKDHENLFSAMQILLDRGVLFKCVLVGKGMELNNKKLVELINRTSSDVNNFIFVGATNDVPAVMNAIDVHVLSSLGEAFPNVVAESMACSTPCVVTDVGDAAIIVADTGWIAPPSNASTLADKILKSIIAMSDSVEWQKRKQACRKRILDNYTIEKMVVRYLQIWNS